MGRTILDFISPVCPNLKIFILNTFTSHFSGIQLCYLVPIELKNIMSQFELLNEFINVFLCIKKLILIHNYQISLENS